MDMVIGIAVRHAFLSRIDFVQPVVGDDLAGDVADHARIGIAAVGIWP